MTLKRIALHSGLESQNPAVICRQKRNFITTSVQWNTDNASTNRPKISGRNEGLFLNKKMIFNFKEAKLTGTQEIIRLS